VEIVFDDPVPACVEAEVVEIGAKGFRAAHDSKTLEPGSEVTCTRGGSTFRARVIWTHVLGGRRVSGFLIL
jgi:hypothetical protein